GSGLPALCLAAIAVGSAASDASCETTRKTVVGPLNSELHRHLPSFLKAPDLDTILALYATPVGTGLTWAGAHAVYAGRDEETTRWEGAGGSEPIRDRYQRLFDLFPTIDRAEVRINRVSWSQPDRDGYPATVRLIVRGLRP